MDSGCRPTREAEILRRTPKRTERQKIMSDTPKTDNGASSAATCSAFESYWDLHGVRINPPILRMAMREVALNAWTECAGKAVLIAESWGHEAPSVMRAKILPNPQAQAAGEPK